MAQEGKYESALSLGKVALSCNADEQLLGRLTALTVVGAYTMATYDDLTYPDENTLKLLASIGDVAPPAPTGCTLLFLGKVLVLNQPMRVAAFRKG